MAHVSLYSFEGWGLDLPLKTFGTAPRCPLVLWPPPELPLHEAPVRQLAPRPRPARAAVDADSGGH